MQELDRLLKKWGVGDRSREVTAALANAVSDACGVPAVPLYDEGDPTGWKMAQRHVDVGPGAADHTRGAVLAAVGLRRDSPVPVSLVWGWAEPRRAGGPLWFARGQSEPSERSYNGLADKRCVRVNWRTGRVEVGHLTVLRMIC